MNNIAISIKELIANQQIEIETLKAELNSAKKGREEITDFIYGIGGPLNDNKLGYTSEQMSDFARIAHILEL